MATKIDMPKWRKEVLVAMTVVASSRELLEKAEADLKQAEADLERLGGGEPINTGTVLGTDRETLWQCDGRPPTETEDGGKCTHLVRRPYYEGEPKPTEQILCWECRTAVKAAAEKAKKPIAAVPAEASVDAF